MTSPHGIGGSGPDAEAITNYRVKRTLTGRLVEYRCSKCNMDLESRIEDAGKRYVCPTCAKHFVVPGFSELNKLNEEQKRKREQKERVRESMAASKVAEATRKAAEARTAQARRASPPHMLPPAQSGPPSPQGPSVVVVQAPSRETNRLGVLGFVISVIGFLTCGFASPIGLILSFIGMFFEPRGLAIAGFILGVLGLSWLILFGFVILPDLRFG